MRARVEPNVAVTSFQLPKDLAARLPAHARQPRPPSARPCIRLPKGAGRPLHERFRGADGDRRRCGIEHDHR